MKNLRLVILIAAISLITYNTKAQDVYRNIPVTATNSFTANYPGTTVKNWKKTNDGYVAYFKMNREKCHAYYDANGQWQRTVADLPLSKLPVEIRYALRQSNYASYHIDNVSDIHTPVTDMYRVEVDNNGGNPVSYTDLGSMDDKLLYFNKNGRLLQSKNNDN